MNLQDWIEKYVDIREFFRGKPSANTMKVYPHFYIDLLAAWETDRQVGAAQVLRELRRRLRRAEHKTLYSVTGVMFGSYPSDVTPIIIEDSDQFTCGYNRRWERGLFEIVVNGEVLMATEVLWHQHDGYGCEAGTVAFSASASADELERYL